MDPVTRPRHIPIRLLIALPGLVVVCLSIGLHARGLIWTARLSSTNADVRRETLDKVSAERERAAGDAVLRLVQAETDPDVVRSAGNALFRIGEPQDALVLLERSGKLVEGEARARFLQYAARLSDRDLRLLGEFHRLTTSADPWHRVGAGVAMLELAEPEGGRVLLASCASEDAGVRDFALQELKRFASPMFQTVGLAVPWPEPDTPDFTARLAVIGSIWATHGQERLLRDVLNRLERVEPEWHEVNRLLHARARVARWLE